MSEQPPPPPWEGQGEPGSQPSPYGPPGPPPQQGLSNKARFWIGVPLAIPALFVAGLVVGAAGALGAAIDDTGGVTTILSGIALLLVVAAFVVALVKPSTRFFALGVMAGTAVILVLAAGACVALLVSYSNSYG